MKRKTQKPSYGIAATKYDAEKVVGDETLKAIGRIVVLWNSIEYELDDALQHTVKLPSEIATSVRSRISGLEAKADILKECLEPMLYFTGNDRKILADTLGDFMILKGFRDNLVHMRLVGSPRNIQAFTPEKRGARYELPFSKQLVLGVASRLRIFRSEMRTFNWLIFLRLGILTSETSRLPYEPKAMRELCERRARKSFQQLQGYRKRRQALLPLPQFQGGDPPPSQWEVQWLTEKRLSAESLLNDAREAVDRKLVRRAK